MEGVIGLLLLVAITAVVIYFGNLKDRAVVAGVGAVNRKVFAKSHADGLELVNSVTFFPVSAPNEQIIAALRAGVRADPQLSVITEGLALASVESDKVKWIYGKKIFTSFTASAITGVEANLDDGTSKPGVVVSFDDASAADGVVHGVSAMKALLHDVETSLRAIDSTTERIVWEV